MRVISQNGKYDVTYENFVFVAEQNMIYAESIAGSGTKQWLMAEYTMPEKTQKAMEMLHDKYNSIEFMKVSVTPEIFAKMQKLLSDEVCYKVVESIFRFLADDEIEGKSD